MTRIESNPSEHIPALLQMWNEFMAYHRDLREWAYQTEEDVEEKIQKRFETYIHDDDKLVLIAIEEEAPAGFAVARLEDASDVFQTGPRARITDFFVREAHRGRNLGKRFVKKIKRWAENKDATAVYMSIDANNEAGKRFWNKMEFTKTRETYLKRLRDGE